MMRCKEMFTALALIAPLAALAFVASPVDVVSEASAATTLSPLCQSTVGVCTVQSVDDAPVLHANVCWDGYKTTLMGVSGCVSGGRGYSITHGLVLDPLSNVVLPIAAVIDTCNAGFCVSDQLDAGDILSDGVACCNPKTGECKAPDQNGVCQFGDITWCKKLEDNGDGSVTCHE